MTLDEFTSLGRPLPVVFVPPDHDPTDFEMLLAEACAGASRGTGRLLGPARTHQWDWDTVGGNDRTIGRIFLSEWHCGWLPNESGVWQVVGAMAVLMLDNEVSLIWIDHKGRRDPVRVPATEEAIAPALALHLAPHLKN